MGDAQPQPSSFRSFFGGKEWLQDFVFDLVGDAGAIVGDGDFNSFFFLLCAYAE
jgi:hypothetical protein